VHPDFWVCRSPCLLEQIILVGNLMTVIKPQPSHLMFVSLKWKQIFYFNCGTKWHEFFNDVFVVGSIRLKHGGCTLTGEDDRLCRDRGSLVLVTSFLCTQWWALHVLNPFIVLVPVNNGDFLNPCYLQRLGWQAQYLPITVNPESRPFRWQPPHSQLSPSSLAWPAPPFHQPTMGESETWVAA
jgi:hypothetical protein